MSAKTADSEFESNPCLGGLDWCDGPAAHDLPCIDCFIFRRKTTTVDKQGRINVGETFAGKRVVVTVEDVGE
jgi:hypothetical protein